MRWQSRSRIAAPLQTLVEELGVDRIALREPGVVDLDALLVEIEAGLLGGRAHAILAADQDRRAEALVDEGIGGADDLLLLALGEHDALGHAAHALDDALHRAGDRVAARRELRLVGVHVDDRPPRDAGVHRRLGHRHRHDVDEARIERRRDDVFAAEARPRAAIGDGDFVGHVLAREFGERVRGGDLHLHVDRLGAHVERAAEDVGKAEDVVDLVGIIRAAGGDDHVVARLAARLPA